MLRFVPDNWLDLLLRPLLLADPVAGLYSELHAPDWRFALLLLFLLIGAFAGRRHVALNAAQGRLLTGLVLAFYLWTLVSGNARYFLWGLLLVGPLVIVAARRLPATQAMRNTVICGAVALQGWAAWMTYEPNVWALLPWGKGTGVPLARSQLAAQPAVFITLGSLSHSILVPQMHPMSRWTNVGGQQDLVPGMREWDRLQELLASPLPRYGVIRASRPVMTEANQPTEVAWGVIRRAFKSQGLAPTTTPCTFLRLDIRGVPTEPSSRPYERGFWFCELQRVGPPDGQRIAQAAPEFDDVFLQVERRCPRYLPSGNALTRLGDDGVYRLYSHSDTGVTINDAGYVFLRNLRAMNPTLIGSVAAVRAGDFKLDCERLRGRYRPPWQRAWVAELE